MRTASQYCEYAEADVLLDQSLALLRARPSPAHFTILGTLEKQYMAQLNSQSPEARATIRAIYEESQSFYPEDSPFLAITAMGSPGGVVERINR